MRKRAGIGNVLLAFFGILVVGALVVGGCAYSSYNTVIQLDQGVKTDWAQVENVLQRRYDLIPNLVETVKGYAKHEEGVFTALAESRTKYFAAKTPDDKIEASASIERALSRLLVLQETYPELKAQANFLQLQDELAGTENRIAVERKRYNDAVGQLNAYIRGLFGQFVGRLAGIQPAKYFEAPEAAQQAPKVDFGTSPKP